MESPMGINLSIKNVPEAIVARLKDRAKGNHRSLQGELLAIVQQAAYPSKQSLTPMQALAEIRALGLKTPSESVQMIREDRDR